MVVALLFQLLLRYCFSDACCVIVSVMVEHSVIVSVMVAAFEGREVSPAVYRKLLTDAVDEESLAVIYSGLHRLLQLALRLPLSSLKQEVCRKKCYWIQDSY